MDASRLLRHSRRRAGLTQRQLAALSGVPQPAIARIERGGVVPRLDTLDRLLAVTGNTIEVVPRLGAGVDRSLIREQRRLSPEERLDRAGRAARALSDFVSAVRDGAPG